MRSTGLHLINEMGCSRATVHNVAVGDKVSSNMINARRLRKPRTRRGMFSVELLATLPIVALVAFAMFELGLLLAATHRIQSAAAAAGREASMPGATLLSVRTAAMNALGDAKFADQCHISAKFGDPVLLDLPLDDARTGDLIHVQIELQANAASPDLLQIVGWSLKNRLLTSSLVVRRE